MNNITVIEGTDTHAIFTVSLNNPSLEAVQFTPSLISGTATAGPDFQDLMYQQGEVWLPATNTLITIPAGQTSVKVRVTVVDDALYEPNETIQLFLVVSATTRR